MGPKMIHTKVHDPTEREGALRMSSVWPQYTNPSDRTHTYTQERPTVDAGGTRLPATICNAIQDISCTRAESSSFQLARGEGALVIVYVQWRSASVGRSVARQGCLKA